MNFNYKFRMRLHQVFFLIVLLAIGPNGFTEEASVIVDSETIVESLLKGDGKTRGISVQPKIGHAPGKPAPTEIEYEEAPGINVAKPTKVNPEVQEDNFQMGIDNNEIQQPSTVALNVQFQFGSAQLTQHAVKQLNELGKALTSSQLSNYTFEIAGHTDSVGKSTYNKWLSQQRAKSVVQYLINNFELKHQKLLTLGYGEEHPLLQDDPTNGINRRVEIRTYTK